MLARVVDVQFQPGTVEEAVKIVRDDILPVIRKQKGFRGQLLLTRADSGKALSLNLWETEADLSAFEISDLYRELMGRLADVLEGPSAGERYEVSVKA